MSMREDIEDVVVEEGGEERGEDIMSHDRLPSISGGCNC